MPSTSATRHVAHLLRVSDGRERQRQDHRKDDAHHRDATGLKRLFLHASTLEFALDGGKAPYLLNAPLAPELVEVLDRLG